MTNINPAPPQSVFNDPMQTLNSNDVKPPTISTQPTMTTKPPAVGSEQPQINKFKGSAGGSNKLWIILLVLLAMIIGFWIGYFTNEYFFQPSENWVAPPPITEPIFEPDFEPDFEPEPMEVNREFIIFRGEQSFWNDGLDFASQEQCVEDEIAMLTAIEDDHVVIQINQWNLQEDSGEYTPELIEFEVRDQECLAVRPVCMDVFIERCFSLELIDGVYHLDYEFREEGTMPLLENLE